MTHSQKQLADHIEMIKVPYLRDHNTELKQLTTGRVSGMERKAVCNLRLPEKERDAAPPLGNRRRNHTHLLAIGDELVSLQLQSVRRRVELVGLEWKA